MSIARLCSVEGCDKSLMCRELCNMHYKRRALHGDIGSPDPLHTSTRHGESKTKLYFVWTAIKQRTSNPNCRVWEFYGGRGIKMHPEWRDSYLAFKRDVIDGYGPGMSIDRIDNDGNYEPGNVRWVGQREQTLNQRLTHSNNKSGYRGVSFDNRRSLWRAYINSEGHQKHLGFFATAQEAAIAYNEAARKYHGELASLNVV